MKNRSKLILTIFAVTALVAPANAQTFTREVRLAPFTATLSNTTPLVFGMRADEVATVLGGPLTYLLGRPGHETMLILRNAGSGFINRSDRLYLQFRNGRLAGWKADWGRNWMWE